MNIGYARTSTIEQIAGFEAQIKELKQAGCEKIYSEQVSSIATRIQLDAAIEFAREGDVLTVTKLDRLARSVADVMVVIKVLKHKNVGLRILNLGMDTSTPTGSLMLTILSGVAQFEREIMLERQREGIAKAKTAGKYKGRKPIAPNIQQEIINLANNKVAKVDIAHKLGIGEATVYRILKKEKNKPKNTCITPNNIDNTAIQRTIKVKLWLEVENNSKFVRGKGKVRTEIEHYLLMEFDAIKLEKDGWEYMLTIPYEDDKDLDSTIDKIFWEMSSTADYRDCFIEANMTSEDGKKSW